MTDDIEYEISIEREFIASWIQWLPSAHWYMPQIEIGTVEFDLMEMLFNDLALGIRERRYETDNSRLR